MLVWRPNIPNNQQLGASRRSNKRRSYSGFLAFKFRTFTCVPAFLIEKSFPGFMVSKFNSFMGDRLTKRVVAFAMVVSLPLSSLLAQDLPKPGDDSFDIEPPLLIQPRELERASDDSQEDATEARPDPGKLAQRLEGAKKSAASAARLVKSGVLSKVEAEQRALRVVRLESELADVQMIAAQEQATLRTNAVRGGRRGRQGECGTRQSHLERQRAARRAIS